MKIFNKLPNGDFIETDPTVFLDMSIKDLFIWLIAFIIGLGLLALPFLIFFLTIKCST
jgi:hypothetical protein